MVGNQPFSRESTPSVVCTEVISSTERLPLYSEERNLQAHHHDLEAARSESRATTRARVESASAAAVGHVLRGSAAITPRCLTKISAIQSCNPCSLGLRESWPHSSESPVLSEAGTTVRFGSRSSDPSSVAQLQGARSGWMGSMLVGVSHSGRETVGVYYFGLTFVLAPRASVSVSHTCQLQQRFWSARVAPERPRGLNRTAFSSCRVSTPVLPLCCVG